MTKCKSILIILDDIYHHRYQNGWDYTWEDKLRVKFNTIFCCLWSERSSFIHSSWKSLCVDDVYPLGCSHTLSHITSFFTTLTQLWDNYETTLRQLCDNFGIPLRQLWENFETDECIVSLVCTLAHIYSSPVRYIDMT